MRWVVRLIGAAAIGFSTVGLLGQSVNFSGKWTLVPGSSSAGAANTSWGWGFQFTVTQEPGRLTVRRVEPGGPVTTTYIFDGLIARWEGARLILRERTAFSADATMTLSLDAAGNLVIRQTSSMGMPVARTYRKG